MANSRLQKINSVLLDCLGKDGWKIVGHSESGIFVKNGTYFVINRYSSGVVPNSYIDTDIPSQCSVELMVHGCTNEWYVERDGFLLREGAFLRFLTKFYDVSYSESEKEKMLEWISELSNLAAMDDAMALQCKFREIKTVEDDVRKEVLDLPVGTITTTFRVLKGTPPVDVWELSPEVVYKIIGITEAKDVFLIAPIHFDLTTVLKERTVKVPLTVLESWRKNTFIYSVVIKNKEKKVEYKYTKILKGSTAMAAGDFSKFNLSDAQRSLVLSAKANGLNYTPLLDNKLSIGQLIEIFELLKSGQDCQELIGRSLSVEHLKYLNELARNKVPFNLFLEDMSVDDLRRKYDAVSETIEDWLEDYDLNVKSVARTEIFKGKSYKHLLVNGKSKIYLQLLAEKDGRFGYLADLMLQNGVDYQTYMTATWLDLSEEQRLNVLKMFSAPGAKRPDGSDYEIWLFNTIQSSIISIFYFGEGKFFLQATTFLLSSDYNSVFEMDTGRRNVVWRSALINSEFWE